MFLDKKAAEIEALIKQAKELTEKKEEAVDTKDLEKEIDDAMGLGNGKEAETPVKEETAAPAETPVEQGPDAKADPLAAIIDYCSKGMYGDAVKVVVEYADKNEYGVSQTIQAWTAKVEEALGPDVAQSFSAAVREGMTQSVNNEKQELKAEKKQQEQAAAEPVVPEAAPATPGAADDTSLQDAMQNLETGSAPEEGGDKGAKEEGSEFMAGEEEEPLTPETTEKDPILNKASLFDYLTKTAYDVNELAGDAPVETTAETATSVDEAVFDEAKAHYTNCKNTGIDCDAQKLAADLGGQGFNIDEATAQKAIDEVDAEGPKDLGDKVNKMDDLITSYNSYQPEASAEDALLETAKTASSAAEWLEKIATVNKQANKLDEESGSPQHPGKKLFNGDKVSYTNGKQQYFPGQKAFQDRKGGNAPVETVRNVAGKPGVDVYNPQVSKANVKSITDVKGGTIAFMQPIKLDEPTHLEAGFDYNGIVTGELQKTKDTKEPLAGAGHKTADYLDKIDKLADKEKVAGDLPKAIASISFTGFQKTAEETQAGNGTIGTDTTAAVGKPVEEKKRELSDEQLVAAQGDIKDRDASLEAAK